MTQRKDFLSTLAKLAPAIATNEVIPVLSRICFTGTRMVAYNDHIGVSVPWKSEFKGAAPGALLIDFLKASRAEKLEFNLDDKKGKTELAIKAGSARLRLAVMDEAEFTDLFKMPKPEGKGTKATEEFYEAIARCLRSVSTDTSTPDQLGITFVPDGKDLLLFSTDRTTLTHARIKTYAGIKERAVIPGAFCQHLLTLAKDEEFCVEVHKEHALATIGDTLLYGRLVEVERPLDFDTILDKNLPDEVVKQLIPIPTALDGVLTRAALITDTDRSATRITVERGATSMKFFARSELYGHELNDSVKLQDKHPEVTMEVDAKQVKAGLAEFDEFVVTDQCVVLAKSDSEIYHLIGARGTS